MITYLLYCAIGRICIFLVQKFPFHKLLGVGRWWREGGFLHDLFACDLCLGVWGYTILAFFFGLNLLEGVFYVPIVSELITGGVTSFIVFLVVRGYQAQYSVIEVT